MRFRFPWCIKPWKINQAWGVYGTVYQQFGFTRHNGVDVALGEGKLIRSPWTGTVIKVGNQPKGGGIFVGILSDDFFDFDDGKNCRVLVDFLHCEQIKVFENQHVIAGQPLAIADNTGFSTGPHTHIQLRRVIYENGIINTIDKNDANNSFDPTPYYTNTYVIDDELSGIQQKINMIADWLKNFLKGRTT